MKKKIVDPKMFEVNHHTLMTILMDKDKTSKFVPKRLNMRIFTYATFHHPIIITLCFKLELEISGGAKLTDDEERFLEVYRHEYFNYFPAIPFVNWARFVIATEFYARAFSDESHQLPTVMSKNQ